MKINDDFMNTVIVYGFFFVVLPLVAVTLLSQPYFEARAYNKFRDDTQVKATYWDALWSDLRITSE